MESELVKRAKLAEDDGQRDENCILRRELAIPQRLCEDADEHPSPTTTMTVLDSDDVPDDAHPIGTVMAMVGHKVNGKEYEAGRVKITKRYFDKIEGKIIYDVRYILFNRVAKGIHSEKLLPDDVPMPVDDDMLEALAVVDDQANANDGKWVRRTTRCAANDQLRRPNVQELIGRLERDSSDDESLVVLRLKNWLEADTNAQVLERIFELVGKSKHVQVLYVQNMEKGMDDKRLELLTKALIANQRLWALNVGENFQISRRGWETFSDNLTKTAVTHIYAGSESTVFGDLKVKMRDAVRENRSKHDLHTARDNLKVILQIGQMWWNPRNSKTVLSYRLEERSGIDFHLHDIVAFKRYKSAENYLWVAGVIVNIGNDLRHKVRVLSNPAIEEWLDLQDDKLSCTKQHDLVLADRRDGVYWPALFFSDTQITMWITLASDGSIVCESSKGNFRTTVYFSDFDQRSTARNKVWKDTMRAAYRLYYPSDERS